MVFVYILKLEGEKYYIGKTTENEVTIEYHNKYDICDWRFNRGMWEMQLKTVFISFGLVFTKLP